MSQTECFHVSCLIQNSGGFSPWECISKECTFLIFILHTTKNTSLFDRLAMICAQDWKPDFLERGVSGKIAQYLLNEWVKC